MEAKLMMIIDTQIEIITHYDLSDPGVQDDLLNLADRFKTVIEEGE